MPPKANQAWTMKRGYAATGRKTGSPPRKPAVQKTAKSRSAKK